MLTSSICNLSLYYIRDSFYQHFNLAFFVQFLSRVLLHFFYLSYKVLGMRIIIALFIGLTISCSKSEQQIINKKNNDQYSSFLMILIHFLFLLDSKFIEIVPKFISLKLFQMVIKNIISVFDRIAVPSAFTGSTGSICGFVGTIGFIVTFLVLFLGSVIDYSQVHYYQSQFEKLANNTANYTTQTDVRIAVIFKNRQTGQPANHTQLAKQIDLKYVLQDSQNDVIYTAPMFPCRPNYFWDKGNTEILLQCITLTPNRLIMGSQVQYISFNNYCIDPFKCPNMYSDHSSIYNYSLAFYKKYYYEIYFTSLKINQKGNQQFTVYKAYSTQTEAPGYVMSDSLVQYDIQNLTVQSSILPWWNIRNQSGLVWSGLSTGTSGNRSQVVTSGVRIYLEMTNNRRYMYRYYRKIDWLIGILGGGGILLYLIFWSCCYWINRTYQKIDTAKALFVECDKYPQNKQDLQPIHISYWYFATQLVSFKTWEKQIIKISENQLSLVELIKKMKVISRNLKHKFQQTNYQMNDLEFLQQNTQQNPVENNQQAHGVPQSTLQIIKNSTDFQQFYTNDPVMLTIIGKNDNSSITEQTIEDQLCRKDDNQLLQEQSKFGCFLRYFKRFFRFFDVFGAQPTFFSEPYNSSCFGCLITFLILLLSCLTFSVAIHNMNKFRPNLDYGSIPLSQVNIPISFGNNMMFGVCFPDQALNTGDIIGNNKKAQLKFYTESITDGTVTRKDIDPVRVISNETFPQYLGNFTSCYRMASNIDFTLTGSTQTSTQSYFGFTLKPYCYGTTNYCTSQLANSYTRFEQFMQTYKLKLLVPEQKYDPQKGKIVTKYNINNLFEIASETVDLVSGIEETIVADQFRISMQTKQTYQTPSPPQQFLTFENATIELRTRALQDLTPSYTLKIRPSGQFIKFFEEKAKVQYILGIIGGIFVFYYFLFHCYGQIYNSWCVRARLAKIIHNEECQDENIFTIFCHLSKIPLCFLPNVWNLATNVKHLRRVDEKMKKILSYIDLVKIINNCWKLSSNFYDEKIENDNAKKNLSLIYFRQVSDCKQSVTRKFNIFPVQNQIANEQNTQNSSDVSSTSRINETIQQQSQKQSQFPKEDANAEKFFEMPDSRYLPQKIIQYFDLFKAKGQFTFQGHREVKSICGGICTLILIVSIILVSYQLIGIYLRGETYTVGYQVVLGNEDSLIFNTGENFKFMYTFYSKGDLKFTDVSSYSQTLGIIATQITWIRNKQNTSNISIQQKTYQFVECQNNYLDGFIGQYIDPSVYSSLINGYCLPDGTKLQIMGNPNSDVRKYFYFSIYNKRGDFTGKQVMDKFFQLYSPQYHFTTPKKDFKASKISYQINSYRDTNFTEASGTLYNITLEKFKLVRDVYDYPTPIDPYIESYDYKDYKVYENANTYSDRGAFSNLTFGYNNRVNIYTITTMKFAEIAGYIGGIIALFIFPVGCCIKSFNQYRMNYLIGKKIYRIYKKSPRKKRSSLKNHQDDVHAINNYTQFQLLITWSIQWIGFIIGYYDWWEKLKIITLIQQKIQEDRNLFTVMKNLKAYENMLNKKCTLTQHPEILLTKLYTKKLLIPNNMIQKYRSNNQSLNQIANQNFLSSWQIKKIQRAMTKNIINDLKDIQQFFQNDQKKHQQEKKNDIYGTPGYDIPLGTQLQKYKHYNHVQPLNIARKQESKQKSSSEFVEKYENKSEKKSRKKQNEIKKYDLPNTSQNRINNQDQQEQRSQNIDFDDQF